MEITLFPMVHIGDVSFYRQTFDDALRHEVVLKEGVNSPVVRHITASYRWAAKRPELGLLVQPRMPEPATPATRVLNADVSTAEFHRLWSLVPIWLRILVYVGAPLIGLRRRWSETRQGLIKGLSLEDIPSNEEVISWNAESGHLSRAILHARDEHLVKRLEEVLAEAPRPKRVAIVYGAQHMRAVIRALSGRLGFHPVSSEWRTIIASA